jgi:hypothetical protein
MKCNSECLCRVLGAAQLMCVSYIGGRPYFGGESGPLLWKSYAVCALSQLQRSGSVCRSRGMQDLTLCVCVCARARERERERERLCGVPCVLCCECCCYSLTAVSCASDRRTDL